MRKVIDIQEIKKQDKTLGPYTRRKCLVKYLENGKELQEMCYLDEESMKDKIYSYIDYLNESKDKGIKNKRSLTSAERRDRNMKASMFYAIGIVLILMSVFGPETAAIPVFIGGVAVLLTTSIIANDLLFYKRIENAPLVLDIESKVNEAKDLEKEVEYELSRKKNMDFARYKFAKNAQKRKQEIVSRVDLKNAIDDLRFKAVRELWERKKAPIPRMDSNYHEYEDVVVARR